MKQLFALLLILLKIVSSQYNILQFGAVPNTDTLQAQLLNQQSIQTAILKANSSQQRTVVIPNHKFYSLPVSLKHIYNLTIQVRGKLIACNRIKNYPKTTSGGRISYQDFISIQDSQKVTITGGGKIDGRGYIWWLNSWLVTKKYMPAGAHRPYLISTSRVKQLSIHDLVLKNSPSFHIKLDQTIDSVLYNLDIKVNTTAQLDILKRRFLTGIVQLFPLNTDGIDPNGRNIHIFNITCQNYDDVVVPKPAHKEQGPYNDCTQNMLIQNITVRLGVGLSIGSVPPNAKTNCIRNITFRNSHMVRPFKGIYIKTNPGNSGNGIIQHILYQNITMYKPIWWAIYLGPQQQKQPDKGGPGCMLYPFDPKGTCQTQPRINISDIVIRNVKIYDSLLFPVVMRCNHTNPCKGVVMEDVVVNKWRIGRKGKGAVCQNVELKQERTSPKVQCIKTPTQKHQQMSSIENQQEKTHLRKNIQRYNELKEKDELNYQLLLKQMQEASKEVPYVQQDDQMHTAHQWLSQDHQYFQSLVLSTE